MISASSGTISRSPVDTTPFSNVRTMRQPKLMPPPALPSSMRPRSPRRVLSASSFRYIAFIVPLRPMWRNVMSPSASVTMLTPAKVRRLKSPAVSSWSRLNRSSDSARSTSTSLRSAADIIDWNPARSSVAPDTAASEYSFAIVQPCLRANSRQMRN
jgi:hypothetical protein